MDSTYEIIRYRSDLKRQVIELQTHLWSSDLALNASYFDWKYERNPYIKQPLIYLAMWNGRVVGMRGFFGIRWECGVPAQRFTSLYADDMVVAPEHRARGLMSKIMTPAFADLADQGYGHVFSLSAGSVTLNSSLQMGWRSAGWVRSMRLRSVSTILRNAVLRRLKKLPGFPNMLAASVSQKSLGSPRPSGEIGGGKIARYSSVSIEDKPRCGAMAELVEQIGTDGRIRHVRDSEYFQWRFQNPQSRYRYIYSWADRLQGYLVLQEHCSNPNQLNIVDWQARDEAVKKDLLSVVTSNFAKSRELVIWSATLPQPTIALLQRCGFRLHSRPNGVAHFPTEILVRPTLHPDSESEWTLGGRRLLDLANWDLEMLYSMCG